MKSSQKQEADVRWRDDDHFATQLKYTNHQALGGLLSGENHAMKLAYWLPENQSPQATILDEGSSMRSYHV